MAPARQFFPGAIDYDGAMSAGYQSGRALSAGTAHLWAGILAPFIARQPNTRLLDLGAGTGRFAVVFARAFDLPVIAIEPSTKMLAAAIDDARSANLSYAAGSAESIPLRDQSCGVAWLSHVWHHIRDHQACAGELRRVVSSGGHVLMRGTFGDRSDGYPTLFRFWPAARQICEQMPTVEHTVGVLEANGFQLTEQRRVEQTTCASLREYAARTRLRADTGLALLSDAEFRDGQAAIEAAADGHDGPVIETIDLLVFRAS
jgi:ubiquinone/menaquinone biosynthesis C-methylase UbiE